MESWVSLFLSTARAIKFAFASSQRLVDDGDSLKATKFEFEYAVNRKGVKNIIPVVMEPRHVKTATWRGPVGGWLGAQHYVAFVGSGGTAEDQAKADHEQEVRALKLPW